MPILDKRMVPTSWIYNQRFGHERTNTLLTHRGNTVPILFVDVDGVISLFGFDAERAPDGRFHWINGLLHYITPTCGPLLIRLSDRFELVWATGWEATANEYLPHLLGLPGELPWLRFDERAQFGTAHWKIDAIAEYAGSERPVAWIDDCLNDDCYAWAEQRLGSTLLIPTRSSEGMRDHHVEELMAWAGSLSNHAGRAG